MVSPTSGTLTTVVSQDPMYVVFPVPTRRAIELREEYSKQGGFDAVKIRLRLPDGRIYGQTGKLDFINNAIAQDTDTFLVRGVISNPVLGSETAGGVKLRELVADEFVTVLLESVQPKQVIAVPRAADPRRSAGQLRVCRRRSEYRPAAPGAPRPSDAGDGRHC